MTSVGLDPCEQESFVLGGQEVTVLWERWYKWQADEADRDGQAALDDENPL